MYFVGRHICTGVFSQDFFYPFDAAPAASSAPAFRAQPPPPRLLLQFGVVDPDDYECGRICLCWTLNVWKKYFYNIQSG